MDGSALLPGLIFNASKTVEERISLSDRGSRGTRHLPAGRLESTMQNLADSLVEGFPEKVRDDLLLCRHPLVLSLQGLLWVNSYRPALR
jgi:hypothetical protein